VFLTVFVWLVMFALNLTAARVSGEATSSPWVAALVDVGLVTLFGLQHSIMARQGFKTAWTRIVPRHLERSTFVWIASGMVALLIVGWQPIAGDLWHLDGAMAGVLMAISVVGWLGVPATSMMTDPWELFGLRQVFDYARDAETLPPTFQMKAAYKQVRHPMMMSFIVAMWFTPHMTVGHLVFAGTMTLYILAGIYFEERDLLKHHGESYRRYQKEVPKLLPLGRNEGAPVVRGREVRL
jgi:protein-S-isoprenylcysteine O-methyltransferase Ste14